MILQLPEILAYFTAYIPITISTAFFIAMLIIGYLIRTKNGYTYGLYLMISAAVSISYTIIYFAINYPFISYTLFVIMGLSSAITVIIITLVGFMFTIMNIISTAFLFIALYHVYHTHKTNRVEEKREN